MEKQLPALIDFFFVQSFFDRVARVQKLFSSTKLSHESSSKCNEAVALTERLGGSQRRSDENTNEYDDIKLVMRRLGLVLEEESEDKKLVFDDISTVFDENEPCLDEVKAAFDVFDQNKDGFVDENELKRVMCALGIKEGMGFENCRKMIRDYDLNGDGLLDFMEFVKVVENSFC